MTDLAEPDPGLQPCQRPWRPSTLVADQPSVRLLLAPGSVIACSPADHIAKERRIEFAGDNAGPADFGEQCGVDCAVQ
jgi:hypothetical protein